MLQDKDGCLGTQPGSSVYPPNPFLDPTSGATFDPDWNAMVTGGPPATPYAQLDFAQLYSMTVTSTTTWDGKPLLAAAALHAVTRDVWFVKAGPVLDICSATAERPIPRIVSMRRLSSKYQILVSRGPTLIMYSFIVSPNDTVSREALKTSLSGRTFLFVCGH